MQYKNTMKIVTINHVCFNACIVMFILEDATTFVDIEANVKQNILDLLLIRWWNLWNWLDDEKWSLYNWWL